MVDTKADTWTKSSFYYDEPSDTCSKEFLISGVCREIPFQRTERRDWFEIKRSSLSKVSSKEKKEKQNKKDS